MARAEARTPSRPEASYPCRLRAGGRHLVSVLDLDNIAVPDEPARPPTLRGTGDTDVCSERCERHPKGSDDRSRRMAAPMTRSHDRDAAERGQWWSLSGSNR